jgi:hypothetical protein
MGWRASGHWPEQAVPSDPYPQLEIEIDRPYARGTKSNGEEGLRPYAPKGA